MERFEGVLEPARQGGAVVALPPEVLAELGRGRRFRARGTFGGTDYRSSTMPTGDGGACLGVHKATREAAGVAFGERVTVEIEPDDEPREIVVPAELDAALDADPALRRAFDALASSHRREYAASVADAKKAETKARRAQKIVDDLRGRSRTAAR